MAQRNTYRDDEELDERINLHDILRIGVCLKPYLARIVRILCVIVMRNVNTSEITMIRPELSVSDKVFT